MAVYLSVAGCGLAMDDVARLERARSAYASGEYRAALIDARNILERQPDNREARLLLGRAALRLDDPATAKKELRRAVELGAEVESVAVDLGRAMLALREYEQVLEELEPGLGATAAERVAVHRLRSEALLELNRPAEALASYKAALAIDPNDLESLVGVASCHLGQGEYEEAHSALARATALNPAHAPALLVSASLYLAAGDHAQAEVEFARAAEVAAAAGMSHERVTALSGTVETQLARDDVASARETLADLAKVAPDSVQTSYLRARVAVAEEDFETAYTELQKVLALAPNLAPAQFLMGAVQLRRNNLAQAQMHLAPLVGDARFDPQARQLLAGIRLRQDRADEAADLLRPLLDADYANLGALNLAVHASLAAGDGDEAVSYLRRALADDPDNTDIRLDLAAIHLATGDVNAAEALLARGGSGEDDGASYRRALLGVLVPLRRGDVASALEKARNMASRWPADARVRNLVGGIALKLDDRELARQSFREAGELDPDDVAARLSLAKMDEEDGDFEAARQQYDAALREHPGSARLMFARGRLEARAGREAEAVAWLEKARAADPTALAPPIVLARYYVAQGEYDAAEAMASDALRIAATSAEAHNLLGLARQGQGDLTSAVESFKEAVKIAPEDADYRLNVARAQAALGNLDEARDTVLAGGELDTGDLRTAVLVAGLEARRGNATQAMQIAKELQARYRLHPLPYALEAELLARGGRFAEAAAAYDKALALRGDDRRLVVGAYRVRNTGGLAEPERPLLRYLEQRPDDAEVQVMLAQHYQQRNDSERAIAAYRRALEAAPDHFVALNNLAWAYFVIGDPRAEQTAERAFERAPGNASVADTLGWIRVQNGELEEGIAALRKAVTLDGDQPEIRYHLAAGLAAAGEKEEARRMLDLALAGGDFASRQDAERLRDSL